MTNSQSIPIRLLWDIYKHNSEKGYIDYLMGTVTFTMGLSSDMDPMAHTSQHS